MRYEIVEQAPTKAAAHERYRCVLQVQDGVETWFEADLGRAILAMVSFAKQLTGNVISKDDIKITPYVPVVKSDVLPSHGQTPLQFLPTEDLLKEIVSRYHHATFIGLKVQKKGENFTEHRIKGDYIKCLGLTGLLHGIILSVMANSRDEDEGPPSVESPAE